MTAVYLAARRAMALTLPPLPFDARLATPLLAVGLALAGLALAWLPLSTAVLLVGGAIFFMLVLIKPVLSLYALIPLIPFSSLFAISGGSFSFGLMELVLALSLAAWLLQILAGPALGRPAVKFSAGPLIWPFLIFLGGASLSWLNAFSISASLIETAKWVEMLALYLLIINLLPASQIRWVVLALIAAGVAQAILGLYQFIFKIGPEGFLLFGGRFLRAYGTFAQPNPYAGYLGLVLPLALSLTIWSLGQPRPSPAGQPATNILSSLGRLARLGLLTLPLGLLVAALFASQSRGAWLGFAGASLVTVVVRSKKAAILVTALAAIIALVGLAGSFNLSPGQSSGSLNRAYQVVAQRFTDAIDVASLDDVATTPVTDANFATLERLAHWLAARDMWRDNPWLGVGFGNYAAIYPAYAVGRWLDPLGHAHNYLLNVGAETGLIGITAYAIFWIFTFGLLWIVVRRSRGFFQAVAAGGLGIMVHLQIHNFVDNLYVQGMYLHIAVVLAIISVIYHHCRSIATA